MTTQTDEMSKGRCRGNLEAPVLALVDALRASERNGVLHVEVKLALQENPAGSRNTEISRG